MVSDVSEKSIKIRGMHCRSCEMLLRDAVGEIAGVKVLSADHKKGALRIVAGDGVMPAVRAAVRKEGYEVID